MRKTFTVASMMFFSALSAYAQCTGAAAPMAQEPADRYTTITSPKITSIGREAPRATFTSYPTTEEAKKYDRYNSPTRLSLNGDWKFKYVEYFKERPTNFMDPNLDVTNWSNIKVPGNWERQGFGYPTYTNAGWAFVSPGYDSTKFLQKPEPPKVPVNWNPTGTYRRDFEVPANWNGKAIFISFDGTKGCAFYYLNGKFLGMSKDSKTPSRFNITDKVVKGKNVLAVQVHRFSDANYMECQDFWRLSGFEREVYIYAQPKQRIVDFHAEARLDDNYEKGILNLDVQTNNKTSKIDFILYDQQGKEVAKGDTKWSETKENLNIFHANLTGDFAHWSCEKPYLYTLVLNHRDENGKLLEATSARVGFRTAEIKDSQFLINGMPVLVKGVNCHEHDEKTGHYVSKELMMKDFTLWKKFNINTVRTCHYPQQELFYDLCDQYGIYVIDEANIETHGMGYERKVGGTLANNLLFTEAHMARSVNVYERDKNRSCVVTWSLGNEAGNGYNFYETYLWFKSVEKMRPVQYENAYHEWNTDIYCPMYPRPWDIERYAKNPENKRPLIMCEYAHSMGNSLGGFDYYWKIIKRNKLLQGGCIWDWVDQGMAEYTSDGRKYWNYGGDYGPEGTPSDGSFCINGIVFPDRTTKAMTEEVRHVYQNVDFLELDAAKKTIRIANGFFFTNLKEYDFSYVVKGSGKKIAEGTFSVDCAPMDTVTATLDKLPTTATTGDVQVEFYAKQRKAEYLIPAGYDIARDQKELQPYKYTEQTLKQSLKGTEKGENVTFKGKDFTVQFNKVSGQMTSYQFKGQEYILNGFGLKPDFWRAPIENDYGNNAPERLKAWKAASDTILKAESFKINGNTITVRYSYPRIQTTWETTYRIFDNGAIQVNNVFNSKSKDKWIPRVGMRMQMPVSFKELSYYGHGPNENYVDRRTSQFMGEYHCNVSDMYEPYIRPEENEHRTQVRWMALAGKGKGLLVVPSGKMEFNASNNLREDLDCGENIHNGDARNANTKHKHACDVRPKQLVDVFIDYQMNGVGGDNSWGAEAHDWDLVTPKDEITYSFTLVPYSGDYKKLIKQYK